MDKDGIRAILPHRTPFLFVDEITELDQDRVAARFLVRPTEPFFAGHFPGFPIMPGVLVIEALAQTSGILFHTRRPRRPDEMPVFLGIERVRFRRAVRPGDELAMEVTLTGMRGTVARFAGTARVNGTVVCQAEFIAGLASRESIERPT